MTSGDGDEHGREPRLWYFAYGSNLHQSIFLERRQMRPLAIRWGWIEGYRLCFDIPVGPGERGVANLACEAGVRTCGVAYLLTASEFDRLDRTEGVNFELYRRIAVQVMTPGEDPIEAFTYQSSVSQSGRKPSPRYIGLLLEGARQHGLPHDWIRFLETFELAVDERIGPGSDPTTT